MQSRCFPSIFYCSSELFPTHLLQLYDDKPNQLGDITLPCVVALPQARLVENPKTPQLGGAQSPSALSISTD